MQHDDAPAARPDYLGDTRRWIERAVIGLNLCPFAKAVYVKDQVRLVLSDATTPEALLEQLRRHGELADADRPAATGDFVTLDLEATRDGEELAGLNTEDWSYEIGQGWVADDFDDRLVGASAGDELRFSATPKGTEGDADFVVRVGKVQQLVVPEATDEWVEENLGEASVVRATVRLDSGEVGHAVVLGRDTGHARMAAHLDALWQCPAWRARVEGEVVAPGLAATSSETGIRAEETEATRVDFFTLVRGED